MTYPSKYDDASGYAIYDADVRHIREHNNDNRSPDIDFMEHELGIGPGEPWCASAVSHWFHRFAQDHPQAEGGLFPVSGSSQAIKHSFDRIGTSSDPQDLMKWGGALGVWTDSDGVHGHIFMIVGRLTDEHGAVYAIDTIEGNITHIRHHTNAALETVPGGCYRNVRNVPVSDGHKLLFLNTTNLKGGSWWQHDPVFPSPGVGG